MGSSSSLSSSQKSSRSKVRFAYVCVVLIAAVVFAWGMSNAWEAVEQAQEQTSSASLQKREVYFHERGVEINDSILMERDEILPLLDVGVLGYKGPVDPDLAKTSITPGYVFALGLRSMPELPLEVHFYPEPTNKHGLCWYLSEDLFPLIGIKAVFHATCLRKNSARFLIRPYD